MENTNTGNGLYGIFHVTVDDRKLDVEPTFSHNSISYQVSEGEKILFTLKLDDKAQWKAVNEESEPDKAFANKVGDAIDQLKIDRP